MLEIVLTIFLVKATLTVVLPQAYPNQDDRCQQALELVMKTFKKNVRAEGECRVREWRPA